MWSSIFRCFLLLFETLEIKRMELFFYWKYSYCYKLAFNICTMIASFQTSLKCLVNSFFFSRPAPSLVSNNFFLCHAVLTGQNHVSSEDGAELLLSDSESSSRRFYFQVHNRRFSNLLLLDPSVSGLISLLSFANLSRTLQIKIGVD